MKRYMIEDTSSGWRYYQHDLGQWCKWDEVDKDLKVAYKIGTEDMDTACAELTVLRAEVADLKRVLQNTRADAQCRIGVLRAEVERLRVDLVSRSALLHEAVNKVERLTAERDGWMAEAGVGAGVGVGVGNKPGVSDEDVKRVEDGLAAEWDQAKKSAGKKAKGKGSKAKAGVGEPAMAGAGAGVGVGGAE